MNISLLGLRRREPARRTILSLVVVSFVLATGAGIQAVQQTSVDELEAKLNSEYATIQKTIF
ncbi:MAG TPA: hypothetical protein VK557_19160, partial [Pyrinomonadaceae bacterium]|nr:hypothetical protein [Pyrinomonadaceae bacterium]